MGVPISQIKYFCPLLGCASHILEALLMHNKVSICTKKENHPSLVPRFPDLFNIAREKRGSLVKLTTCVTSGGTNFHIIWHNSGSRGEISH